jgi:hypothetical protein
MRHGVRCDVLAGRYLRLPAYPAPTEPPQGRPAARAINADHNADHDTRVDRADHWPEPHARWLGGFAQRRAARWRRQRLAAGDQVVSPAPSSRKVRSPKIDRRREHAFSMPSFC